MSATHLNNSKNGRLMIFSGRASETMAKNISTHLTTTPGVSECKTFSDGEIWFKFSENIRGADLFLVQSTHPPVDNLFELLIMCDAARRASAYRINVVIPYFGYARQDRKDQPRVAITAKLAADLLVTAGAHRVLTMDLHAAQIQGFFNIPVDHLYSAIVMTEVIRKKNIPDLTMVAPDIGGTNLARAYAKRLGVPIALVEKRRPQHNEVEAMNIYGDVKGKNCLIVDDICDTAGTLTAVAAKLIEGGAKSVRACITHPVLSGEAVKRIEASVIEELFFTDTIPIPRARESSKFNVVSVAELFAKAIKCIHEDASISSLFA